MSTPFKDAEEDTAIRPDRIPKDSAAFAKMKEDTAILLGLPPPTPVPSFEITDITAMLLDDVVNSTDPDRLRQVFHEICGASDDAFRLACTKLLVEPKRVLEPAMEARIKWLETRGLVVSRKRAYSFTDAEARYETCRKCLQEYEVLENSDESCVYHKGALQQDREHPIWLDWPEFEEEGTQEDKDEMLLECPEAFFWGCCAENSDHPGCGMGAHRVDRTKRIRTCHPGTLEPIERPWGSKATTS